MRLQQQGDYQGAIAAYKATITHQPEDAATFHNTIAMTYILSGNLREAIPHYTTALALGGMPIALTNRADTYLQLGDCGLATQDADQVLADPPIQQEGYNNHAEAHYILARCYAYNDRMDLAIQHNAQSRSIGQQWAYPATRLDRHVIFQTNADQGTANFLPPTEKSLHHALALANQNHTEEALQVLQTARVLHGKPSAYISRTIADEYLYTLQYQEAIEHYSISLAVKADPSAQAGRAWAYEGSDQCQLASADARATLDQTPYAEDGYHTYVEAHHVLALYSYPENPDLAASHINEALSLAKASNYPDDHIVLIQGLLTRKTPKR